MRPPVRTEIEELCKQGKWKTHEDVEREMREADEAARRRQQGMLGKLEDLVGREGVNGLGLARAGRLRNDHDRTRETPWGSMS